MGQQITSKFKGRPSFINSHGAIAVVYRFSGGEVMGKMDVSLWGVGMSEEKLDRIELTLEKLGSNIGQLGEKVGKLDVDVRIISDRVDTYQKASTQVVNLAFSLIVAATLAIIVPVLFNR